MKDKKTFISTAQPNPEEIRDYYESFLKQGKDILAICLSSKISGTFNGFSFVAYEVLRYYPERKIIIVDSLKYSSAIGLLCIYASINRANGLTIEENAAWLEVKKYHLHQMGVLDDLFFCSRMGRVSGVTAIGGTLIGIKPLADFDRTGLSHKIGACRGMKKTFSVIKEYISETIIEPENQIIAVVHSLRKNEAEQLKQLIEDNFHPKEVIMTIVGQSCGPGIGPGLFAAFYLGTEISENMEKETEIINRLTNKK